jgi:SAM-dependent methyltransferase
VSWNGPTAEWWQAEVANDPAYQRDVDSVLSSLLLTTAGRWLDIGCGDGRLLGRTGAVGLDSSLDLARVASAHGAVVVGDAERLPFAEGSFDGAYAVLVVEHVGALDGFFAEAARVVQRGGALVVVVNHPLYTAPGSGPFVDPDDGEVLWRWGAYLSAGSTDEPAGDGTIEFRHRSLGEFLTAAADAGWALERLTERALDPADDPLLAVQGEVPRLLGARWRRAGSGASR